MVDTTEDRKKKYIYIKIKKYIHMPNAIRGHQKTTEMERRLNKTELEKYY